MSDRSHLRELLNGASESAIAEALLKQQILKAAAEILGPPPVDTAPEPRSNLSYKTSWSMHMMVDVLYAHFQTHYTTYTPANPAESVFNCSLEEQHDIGRCAFRIELATPTPRGVLDIIRDEGLKTARAELDHFAEYLDDVRYRSGIDDLSIETRMNADGHYMFSMETGRKRAIFELMQQLQNVHPQFYAGPLDVFDTIDFGTTSKDKADRWEKVYALAEEFCNEFTQAAQDGDYGDGPNWMNAIAGIPITSEKTRQAAIYMGQESLSPYSLADIEVTLCREEGKEPPYHLRHPHAAIGIN